MKEHRVCNETGRKEGYSFVGEGTIHYSARSTNACAWVVRPSVVSLCICMCVGFPFNYFIIISKGNYSNLHCPLISYYSQGNGKSERKWKWEKERTREPEFEIKVVVTEVVRRASPLCMYARIRASQCRYASMSVYIRKLRFFGEYYTRNRSVPKRWCALWRRGSILPTEQPRARIEAREFVKVIRRRQRAAL